MTSHKDQQGIANYIATLKQGIMKSEQHILRQNIKAREEIFNIAAHFGFHDLTRQKIQQNFEKSGVIGNFVGSGAKNGKFNEKGREKDRIRRIRNSQDEFKVMGEARKKIKFTLNTDQYNERPRNK